MEKSVTFNGACANVIPSINHSFVYKAKEGHHVRILYSFFFFLYIIELALGLNIAEILHAGH